MTSDEVADANRLFAVWEDGLTRHGGPYLAGQLSLADLAFVPTVLRIGAHDPDLSEWRQTAGWMERIIARPSVQQWLGEANGLPVVRLSDYYEAP